MDLQLWGIGLSGVMLGATALAWSVIERFEFGRRKMRRIKKFTGLILALAGGAVAAVYGHETGMHWFATVNHFTDGFMIALAATGIHSTVKNTKQGIQK